MIKCIFKMLIMENVIIVIALLAIIGLCALYIVRAKRRGEKCIGCPHSKECKGGCKIDGEKK